MNFRLTGCSWKCKLSEEHFQLFKYCVDKVHRCLLYSASSQGILSLVSREDKSSMSKTKHPHAGPGEFIKRKKKKWGWSSGVSGWRVWLPSARWLVTVWFKSDKNLIKKDKKYTDTLGHIFALACVLFCFCFFVFAKLRSCRHFYASNLKFYNVIEIRSVRTQELPVAVYFGLRKKLTSACIGLLGRRGL